MRIYITGATGFVGKNLWNYLSQPGFSLTALSLRTPVTKESIRDADTIIHLAGKAHDLKNVSDASEYYAVNFELTKTLYDHFLSSNAHTFIFISSVKAVADQLTGPLTEEYKPSPQTHYGKSKRMAEEYIEHHPPPKGKRVYILRPCMIHGPGNKGNLNLLYNLVLRGIPWPLGSFSNQRSFLSVENLCFIIKEFATRPDIPQGIYQVADNDVLSTTTLIRIMASELSRKPRIFNFPKKLIVMFAKLGDTLHLPLNSERLGKLAGDYVVSTEKLKKAIGKPLPVSAFEGISKTIRSFRKDQ